MKQLFVTGIDFITNYLKRKSLFLHYIVKNILSLGLLLLFTLFLTHKEEKPLALEWWLNKNANQQSHNNKLIIKKSSIIEPITHLDNQKKHSTQKAINFSLTQNKIKEEQLESFIHIAPNRVQRDLLAGGQILITKPQMSESQIPKPQRSESQNPPIILLPTIKWQTLSERTLLNRLNFLGLTTNQAYALIRHQESVFFKRLPRSTQIGLLQKGNMLHVFILAKKKLYCFHAPAEGYNRWYQSDIPRETFTTTEELLTRENFLKTYDFWIAWNAESKTIKKQMITNKPIKNIKRTIVKKNTAQSYKGIPSIEYLKQKKFYTELDLHFKAAPIQGKNYRYSGFFGMRLHPIKKVYKMHRGVDIAARLGEPVFAVNSGKIKRIDYEAGWGLYVLIEHANQYYTRYAHLNAHFVSEGDLIEAGDCLGEVGRTGGATAEHLHLELFYHDLHNGDQYIDALPYCRSVGMI